jgi:hypothetical protein
VASASAMASLSGLSDSTPVAVYAAVMMREGAARVEALHRNAANVKLKTADGKSIWTKEEDTSVLHFVADWIRSRKIKPSVPYTDWKWDECAEGYLARSRSSKQCRERWANVLNPLSKHDEPWSKEEITLLLGLHGRFGKKWREVAKRCPGRKTNKVRDAGSSASYCLRGAPAQWLLCLVLLERRRHLPYRVARPLTQMQTPDSACVCLRPRLSGEKPLLLVRATRPEARPLHQGGIPGLHQRRRRRALPGPGSAEEGRASLGDGAGCLI